MRVLGWAATALGLLVLGFVVMVVVDASLPQAYNLHDPEQWLGAVAIAAVGLGVVGRVRETDERSAIVGTLVGGLLFAALLLALYLLVIGPIDPI